jgi:hypothetical protein
VAATPLSLAESEAAAPEDQRKDSGFLLTCGVPAEAVEVPVRLSSSASVKCWPVSAESIWSGFPKMRRSSMLVLSRYPRTGSISGSWNWARCGRLKGLKGLTPSAHCDQWITCLNRGIHAK